MIIYWNAPAKRLGIQAFGPIVGLEPMRRRYLVDWPTTWGRQTGVAEANKLTFLGHWTGTGTISGSGDAEQAELTPGSNLVSDITYTGGEMIELLYNHYDAGDTIVLSYRTGADVGAVGAAGWTTYTVPFVSDGFVQIKIEAP